jgi:hypothetical protein
MIYPNPHVQEILEAIHSALRSLSDRPFEYEVRQEWDMFKIIVHCGKCHTQVSVDERSFELPGFLDSVKYHMPRVVLSHWIEAFTMPVDHSKINLRVEPRPPVDCYDCYKAMTTTDSIYDRCEKHRET